MSTEANPGSPHAPKPEQGASGDHTARPSAFGPVSDDQRRAESAEAAAAAEAAAGMPRAAHHDDLIASLRRELSDLKDKNLRLLAEMENLRRRTDEEKSSAARYAITRFATDIVGVGDNFGRAMSAVPAGAVDTDPTLKSLVEGVQMTEREFLNVLDRHGVKRINAKGQIFNPHLHQAMMQVPNPSVPAGTVLQVFQDGYTIGDRLLRAAVVTVAEGGPKPQKPAEAANANDHAPGNDTGPAE